MKEYFIGVAALVLFIGVMRMISYRDGADSGSRLAFAVLILYVVFIPMADTIKEISKNGISPEIISPDISEYENGYEKVAEDAFVKGVRSAVCQRFSLDESDVRVMVEDFDVQSMRAGRIRIFLSGKGIFASYKDVEKYIEENNLGECDAEIEIG